MKKNNLSVLVVDKGFLPGGRTASKTINTDLGNAVFDYGAQYFTVESIEFLKQVNEWVRNGLVDKWATNFESFAPKKQEDKVRYKEVIAADTDFYIDELNKRLSAQKGIKVDFSSDILNGGFKIVNPNAERTCGCGTSFSV